MRRHQCVVGSTRLGCENPHQGNQFWFPYYHRVCGGSLEPRWRIRSRISWPLGDRSAPAEPIAASRRHAPDSLELTAHDFRIDRVTIRDMTCPLCQQPSTWKDNPWRPFCSERCQAIDLGAWASEYYRVPGPALTVDDSLPDSLKEDSDIKGQQDSNTKSTT